MLVVGVVMPLAVGERAATSVASGAAPETTTAGPSATVDSGDAPTELVGVEPDGSGGDGATAGRDGAGQSIAPATGAGPTPSPPASDRGITPSTIRLGVVTLRSPIAERLGFALDIPTHEQQQQYWQGVIEHLNRHGGINGRTVEPVFQGLETGDRDLARTICLHFTEDVKVFAVAGLIVDTIDYDCYIAERSTPLITRGLAEDRQFSNGLLVTLRPRTGRVMGNLAAEVARLRLVQGVDVGILGSNRYDPRGTAAKLLEGLVDRAGANSSHVEMISADRGTSAGQIPVVVNKWRTTGIDTVLLVSDPLDSMNFVNEAESQGWTPKYATSDFGNGADQDTGVAGQGRSYEQAPGITSSRHGEMAGRVPLSAPGRECERRYTDGSGQPAPTTQGTRNFLWEICDFLDFFAAGARAAGPDLTRAAWSREMQRLGPMPSASSGGGSFAPGKLDFADVVREVRFGYDCRCWRAATPFGVAGRDR